jgi:hypothetical protein
MMDDRLCSCDHEPECVRDECGLWRAVVRPVYDPMCLVHGQVGIS